MTLTWWHHSCCTD